MISILMRAKKLTDFYRSQLGLGILSDAAHTFAPDITALRGCDAIYNPAVCRVSPRAPIGPLCHSFGTPVLEAGYDIRTQEVLRHRDVSATMSYTFVLNRGGRMCGARSMALSERGPDRTPAVTRVIIPVIRAGSRRKLCCADGVPGYRIARQHPTRAGGGVHVWRDPSDRVAAAQPVS